MLCKKTNRKDLILSRCEVELEDAHYMKWKHFQGLTQYHVTPGRKGGIFNKFEQLLEINILLLSQVWIC